ncbi:NAD(P)H-binding protein [Sphingobacterium deserti]|uniref:NAD(P)-binding domain-containing protein n=1 Tax=Sphingobacterium deserti TaxID=1229276 RepID=A0A0B8T5V5_9SPHI|nr:NAD(P)H-binding protein [Sphingobacterium deserti]KGE12320.1 hypothetical protein DI53_3890 [Sphingobacterium deserti]
MKALVIGATGATGKEVVRHLLENPDYAEISVFVRRPSFATHPTLKEVVVDFEKLESFATEMHGDVAFSCLGTTKKDAGSEEAQWRVDHDYQLLFAKLCKQQGVSNFVLLSALGADAKSLLFYNRMKGQLEEAVRALGFAKLTIVQPSLIIRPDSNRTGEVIAGKVLQLLNKVGLFKKYAGTSTAKLGKVLVDASLIKHSGVSIITTQDYNRNGK